MTKSVRTDPMGVCAGGWNEEEVKFNFLLFFRS